MSPTCLIARWAALWLWFMTRAWWSCSSWRGYCPIPIREFKQMKRMQNLISYLIPAKSCRDCESASHVPWLIVSHKNCNVPWFTQILPWLWSRIVTVPSAPLLGKNLPAVGQEGQTPARSSSSAHQDSTELMAHSSYSDPEAPCLARVNLPCKCSIDVEL